MKTTITQSHWMASVLQLGKINCPFYLRRNNANGEMHYSHVVVGATLVHAGSHEILPLDAEEVRNSDGQEKQDCENNAGKRLVIRLRQDHPQLQMIVTGHDLYSHEPFISQLRELRYGFVLTAKPSSHKVKHEPSALHRR